MAVKEKIIENSFKPKSTTLYQYWARVVQVIDGDTVDLEVSLGFDLFLTIRARLLGISTHEIFGVKKKTKEYVAGLESKKYLQSLIPENKWIEIKVHRSGPREKYGRWLATLYSNGVNINDKMVKSRHAKKYLLND